MSKHGGSPSSGLVLPMGLESLQPATPAGMVLVPQEVVDAREQARKREERALQLERRRIAVEVLPAIIAVNMKAGETTTWCVETALHAADLVIEQTGGGI